MESITFANGGVDIVLSPWSRVPRAHFSKIRLYSHRKNITRLCDESTNGISSGFVLEFFAPRFLRSSNHSFDVSLGHHPCHGGITSVLLDCAVHASTSPPVVRYLSAQYVIAWFEGYGRKDDSRSPLLPMVRLSCRWCSIDCGSRWFTVLRAISIGLLLFEK